MRPTRKATGVPTSKKTRAALCLWEAWAADPRYERCSLHGEVRRRPEQQREQERLEAQR